MPAWLPRPLRQPKTEDETEDNSEDEDGDFSNGEDDEDFELHGVPPETSSEDELESDVEESDDNSAILDDGDANED